MSPSKRRQSASHYSDLECSPSKKRDSTDTLDIHKLAIEDSERGLLFGNSTNLAVEIELSVGVVNPVKSKLAVRPRRTRAPKVKEANALESRKVQTRKRTEMWVEVETRK